MKKFGLNNKNPNPPWPSEQPVVIVPPGSNPTAVGVPDEPLRSADTYDIFPNIRDMSDSGHVNMQNDMRNQPMTDLDSFQSANSTSENAAAESPEHSTWLMGDDFRPSSAERSLMPRSSENGLCAENGSISGYLRNRGDVRVTVEFAGDRLPNGEKSGILSGIGKDFIAIRDSSNGNTVVCPINKIKAVSIDES